MRCCLPLVLCSLAIGYASAAEFGGPCQQPCQQPSQKDVAPRGGPPATQPRDIGGQAVQETGFYQAGPRSGAFEGASGALGFRGGGITLPEIKLCLPTLEFPSLFRSRYGARMVYKGGEAPWISTGFGPVGKVGIAGRAVAGTDSRAADEEGGTRTRESAECAEWKRLRDEYQRKIEELDRKLEDCDDLTQLLQERLRAHAARAVPPAVGYIESGEMRRLHPPMETSSDAPRPLQSPLTQVWENPRVQRASFSETAAYGQQSSAIPRPLPPTDLR